MSSSCAWGFRVAQKSRRVIFYFLRSLVPLETSGNREIDRVVVDDLRKEQLVRMADNLWKYGEAVRIE